jgi:RNA polymerase-binding transcription factor DksA
MSTQLNSGVVDNPVDQNGGVVWNRLHSEREDICDALNKQESHPRSETPPGPHEIRSETATDDANWHRELLEARLRKVDHALDRLMSGSYGNCSRCDKWIEDTKLEFDPAIEFCLGCWEREQNQSGTKLAIDRPATSWPAGLALATVAQFDTVHVRTLNSDYRFFLLDPKTGRALVVGGLHFAEPVEALVSGSKSWDSTIRNGELCIGLRIEMWVSDKLVSTSPIQSVRVEHNTAVAPNSAVISNLVM